MSGNDRGGLYVCERERKKGGCVYEVEVYLPTFFNNEMITAGNVEWMPKLGLFSRLFR